jgi:hypothetical protein
MGNVTYVPGATVTLTERPPYLKTADPMPMLRPADLLNVGEEGVLLEVRPGNYWAVKFAAGVFLLDPQYFVLAETTDA